MNDLLTAKMPRWVVPVMLLALGASAAPTLPWLEFSGGSENLNVATALEIRRTGNWLIPTLQGKPRIAKPPLTAWITASAISRTTMSAISSPDQNVREAGFKRLAWEVRWPALLMSCLALAGVFALGKIAADEATGLAAMLICGTCYAFLRFSRMATTDVTLNLFVVCTNVFLAMAILKGNRRALIPAGVMLGLAFMGKGPVAFAETLLPVCVAAALIGGRRSAGEGTGGTAGNLLLGTLAMLLIGLPWYGFVAMEMRRRGLNISEVWMREVTGVGMGRDANAWYAHISYFPMFLPWILFLVGGMWLALQRRGSLLFCFILAILPILAISLSPDRKERFLLPMIAPGAVLAGFAAIDHARRRSQWSGLDKLANTGHWLIVIAVGILFPSAAATPFVRTAAGEPWLSPIVAALIAIPNVLIVLVGWVYLPTAKPRWRSMVGEYTHPTIATAAVMLIVQAPFAWGYSRTEAGLSAARPLAHKILAAHPDAELFSYIVPRRREPEDLAIYANRLLQEINSPNMAVGDRAVLVTIWRKGKPQPEIPAEWEQFADSTDADGVWLAYWRPR